MTYFFEQPLVPPAVPIPSVIPRPPKDLAGRFVLAKLLSKASNAGIRKALAELDLPSLNDRKLDSRRERYHTPPAFRFDPKHHESVRYVGFFGLDGFLRDTTDAKDALWLVQSSRARELAEAALLMGFSDAAVVRALQATFDMKCTGGGIREFQSLYFRLGLFPRAELGLAIAERVAVGIKRVGGSKVSAADLAGALARDPRVLASQLSPTPESWSRVLLAMGLAPQERRAVEKVTLSPGRPAW